MPEGVKLLHRRLGDVPHGYHLSLVNCIHDFNPCNHTAHGPEGVESQHGASDPFHRSVVLLNGMITNEKFCLIRQCQVPLRWSRRPYRFRLRKSDYLLDEVYHREGSHETPLADTSAIPANGGRRASMGSGVPIPAAMD